MIDTILFYLHHALTLLWGVLLSAAFCEVRFNKRNIFIVSSIFATCAFTQVAALIFSGGVEQTVWQLYPLIVHLPLLVLLCLIFKKRIITALASISLAYLCCQPSKWFGLLVESFVHSSTVVWCVKIIVALIVGIVTLRYLAAYISKIFNKDTRSVLIFCSIPLIYYMFDYVVGIYTDLWVSHYRLAAEFLSFALCISFMLFCTVYYKEYEKRMEAEHKEEIIKIAVEQQAKEVETIKKSNLETSLLRHDMRLLLGNLSLCIEQDDKEQALKTISGFVKQVESASLHRYCKNDTINYILANFQNRCKEQEIDFLITIEIEDLPVDEILFSSIISNALENAVNAQEGLPVTERFIKLMLKNSGDKLLLSVKNPFDKTPVIIDGIPITHQKGHGYGTQSIRYMTEKLGGKYQFSLKDNLFILRVVL